MRKPIFLTLCLFALLALAIFSSLAPQANAQDGSTPAPVEDIFKYDEPAHVEGDAEWTLTDSSFTSNYPDGFSFKANASSTGGELVSVSVFYSFNPNEEDDSRQRGEVDPATGDLNVFVAGTNADGIPPWVTIAYRWRVLDAAGTVYWSQWFVENEYADNTHVWERRESEDVLIFEQEGLPAEAVDMAFAAMAEARPIYEEAFGRLLSYKPRMVLFNDLETFNEWRSFEYQQGGTITVGLAYAQYGMFVQVLREDDYEDFAYGIVVHEIAHLYQYDLYESRAPAWWTEGNATYFELSQFYDYEGRVRLFAATNELPRLFVGEGPNTGGAGPDGSGRWGYDVGYTFNKWLVDNYGWEAHRELIELLAAPENMPFYEVDEFFEESLETVLGMSTDEIETAWRVWLGASGAAPTLFPTPTQSYVFPPTVTPFGQ